MMARLTLTILPFIGTLLVAGCQRPAPAEPPPAASPDPATVEAAIKEAFTALARPEIDDPFEALFVDITHRRFGRAEGAGAMAEYRLFLGDPPQPDRRLMGRWGDANTPFDEAATLGLERSNSNRGLLEAMYCKERPIPADYADYAREAIAKGGYDLTHVVIGYAFAKEAGCAYPLSAEEVEQMCRATAALLQGGGMTDLQLEAALVLAWAGRRDLLPPDLVARTLAVRWLNGAWAYDLRSKAADGHATMLALCLLLELTATPRGPVVAR